METHAQGTALLRLLQLSDSAFPTGAFSHSMSLEAFAEAGELVDAADLKRIIEVQLFSLATSDCVALRASYGADLDKLFQIDRLLTATKLARELRAASASIGKRFLLSVGALGVKEAVLQTFTNAVRDGTTPGNLAVGYGVAAPALGLGLEESLHAHLYATTASLVAAGQKLIPLGGSAAQRVLYETAGSIERAAKISETMEVEDMYAFAPIVDVRSMLHERQRTRLYIS
jgi:urease accessory protein